MKSVSIIQNQKSKKYRSFKRQLSLETARIWEYMVRTGLRVSDVCTLKYSDIERGFCIERKTGKKHHVIPIWWRPSFPASPDEFVFASPRNHDKPISRQAVYYQVQKASRIAGYKHLSCHSARKTYAWNLWESSHDIISVMEALNHSSPGTTAYYLFMSQKE